MKFAIFLLALVAAASAINTRVQPAYKFEQGKTYVYDYQTQLVTGMPGVADQMSGLFMKGDLILQGRSDSEVALKLKSIRVGSQLEMNLREQDDDFEGETIEGWTKYHEEQLKKPIVFSVVDGKIVSFVCEESEPQWSLNLKKAILSLLNLEINPKEVISRSVEGNLIPKFIKEQEELSYFGIFEQGLEGLCETTYQINREEDQDQEQGQQQEEGEQIKVTKVKNYNNCLTKKTLTKQNGQQETSCPKDWTRQPEGIKGYYPVPSAEDSTQCKYHEIEEQRVAQYHNVQYDIKGNNVESIYAEGKVTYQLFGDNLMAITTQNLTLQQVKDESTSQQKIESISEPKIHYTLTYRLPVEDKEQKEQLEQEQINMDVPFMSLFGKMKKQQLEQQVPQLVRSLAKNVINKENNNQKEQEGESTQNLVQAINAMSVLKRESLESIFRQITEQREDSREQKEEKEVCRKIFLDVLALCGTNEAALYVKDLILQSAQQQQQQQNKPILQGERYQQLTQHEARHLLASIPENLYKADVKTMDQFSQLAREEVIRKEQPLVHEAAAICFAKMVQKSCVSRDQDMTYTMEQQDGEYKRQAEGQWEKWIQQEKDQFTQKMHQQQICRQEDLERYILVAKRLMDSADSFTQKVAAIEAIAHIGTQESVKVLAPFVTGQKSLSYDEEKEQVITPEQQYEQEQYMRTICTYALAHVAKRFPEEVAPLALTVYRNQNNRHQLRIAGFAIYLMTQPEEHMCESIASDLHQEEDKQVKAYVVSAFQSLKDLSVPTKQMLAQAAEQVKDFYPEITKGYKYSQYFGKDYYNQEKAFGIWASAEWIKESRSAQDSRSDLRRPIPSAAYVAVNQIVQDLEKQILEVGFTQQGLEQLIPLVLGQNGLLSSLIQGNRMEMKNMKQEMNIHLFIKSFESTNIMSLDKDQLQKLVIEVESTLKEWTRELERGYQGVAFVKVLCPNSFQKMVPSHMGLPIMVSHKHPIIISLKVNEARIQRKGEHNIKVTIDMEPKMTVSAYTFLYGFGPADLTTVGTHVEKTTQVSLPLRVTLKHEEKNQWECTLESKMGHHVLTHKSEGKTFISTANMNSLPSRHWLESAQTIRRSDAAPVKTERRISPSEQFPVALKVSIDAEHKIDMESLHKTVSNKGYLPAALEFFHKTGLRDRQVIVTLEQQKEKPVLRFQWTMDEEKIAQRINGSVQRLDIDDKLDQEYERFEQYDGEQDREEQQELEKNFGIWGRKTHQRFNHRQNTNGRYQSKEQGVRRYFNQQHQQQDAERNNEREQNEFDDDFHMNQEEKEQQRRYQNRREEKNKQQDDEDEYIMDKVVSQVDSLFTGRKSRSNHMDRWIHQTRKAMEWAQHQEQEEKEGRYPQSQQKEQQQKERCHFMKTDYIIKGNRVCFTTRPVLSCGGQCKPQQQKTMEFSFHCLPAAEPFTQSLINQASFEVLRNIANKRVDLRQPHSVPVACAA